MSRVLALAISASLSAAALSAPLATIDSEQRGAAAYVTMTYATSYSEGIAVNMVQDSLIIGELSLQRLNTVTTPAALRAMPGGLSLPCANGGTVTTRLARGPIRALDIEWSNCQLVSWNPTMILTGPGQIILFTDSFTPTYVAAITLGSANRNVVMPWGYTNSEETYTRLLTRNVRMIGKIQATTSLAGNGSLSTLYTVNGFRDEVNDRVFTDPGHAPEHLVFHSEIRNGIYGDSFSWKDDGFYFDDEMRFVTGDYTSSVTEPYYGTSTVKWSVDNLRTHRITDYANWKGSYSYDGGFSWTWTPNNTAGCLGGRFTVKTRAPFVIPNLDNYGVMDSGELGINNGAATYRAYSAATVPPELPPTSLTLLSMTVRDVGTFNYDYGLAPDPVRDASQCH